MKKIILLISLLLLPNVALAAVDGNTQAIGATILDDETIRTKCYNAENDNSGYTNATNGYFLECVAVKCDSNKNTYHIENQIADKLLCANGNKNPLLDKKSSGVDGGTNLTFAENGTCNVGAEAIDILGNYAYGTRIYKYDCSKLSNGSDYNANSNNNTNNGSVNNNQNNNNTNDNIESPETGIEDYYKILIPTILVISLGLYFVNKKNLFKRF